MGPREAWRALPLLAARVVDTAAQVEALRRIYKAQGARLRVTTRCWSVHGVQVRAYVVVARGGPASTFKRRLEQRKGETAWRTSESGTGG